MRGCPPSRRKLASNFEAAFAAGVWPGHNSGSCNPAGCSTVPLEFNFVNVGAGARVINRPLQDPLKQDLSSDPDPALKEDLDSAKYILEKMDLDPGLKMAPVPIQGPNSHTILSSLS